VSEVYRHRAISSRAPGDALDLNLRSIDVFVQIAETGGMSTTARRMGLTQSAVSQMIANLENSLGVQLFDRQVRPLALTPSGVILLERARGLLLSARDAINAARQPNAAALPKLNLCLVDTIAGTIGPDLVAGMQGSAVQWSIHAGLSSQHKLALLSREADIIISPDPLEDEANLERHEIVREPFVLVLPRHYIKPVASISALAGDLDFIRFSARSLLGRQVERHLRRLRTEAQGHVEFDSSASILAMVAAELGFAILTPLCAMLATGYWPLLRIAPMPEPTLFRRIYVIARQGELGELPRKIAEMSAAALRCVVDARLQGELAWMRDDISIPSTPRTLCPAESIVCRSRESVISAVPPLISSARLSPLQGSIPSGKLARSS